MQAVGVYPVQGIIDMKNPNLNNLSVFMNLDVAQNFVSADDMLTSLVINKDEYFDENQLAKKIRSITDYESNDVEGNDPRVRPIN